MARSQVLAMAVGRRVYLGASTAVLAGRYGDRVAIVDPAPTPGLDHGEQHAFLRWARDRVAGYRRPTQVVATDSLPRRANGMLDRPGATDLAVADGGAA